MAVKKLRKKRIAPPVSEGFRPREPEHTATFWRNSYEAEKATTALQRIHLDREREEVARLKKEIERLKARGGRKRVKRLS